MADDKHQRYSSRCVIHADEVAPFIRQLRDRDRREDRCLFHGKDGIRGERSDAQRQALRENDESRVLNLGQAKCTSNSV